MTEQWAWSLAGGLMIGTAALLLYALSGRIAGISGIGFGLLTGATDRAWRLWFLGGLIGGAWVAALSTGLAATPPPVSTALGLSMAGAGLLVGIGTRVGNGCTSGHGVCGLARLSRRSLAATITFMALGMLTASAIQRLAGV
ncbi:MAG: YeeE/YedE thiosulfate transporter family protein [Pseudomonadota bacterium]|nr:YeeE/YedE thiosulfate transporter family protein [Pseudomonadota bacterium]